MSYYNNHNNEEEKTALTFCAIVIAGTLMVGFLKTMMAFAIGIMIMFMSKK
ncbi:MAG: hypothetical protein KAS32_09765 [Candidatus Peribacteraceae bacterium]|nr:hypothetical protein [Candidatus Peribacteraceae bacterium]